jgi:hypothetical protein
MTPALKGVALPPMHKTPAAKAQADSTLQASTFNLMSSTIFDKCLQAFLFF